MDRRNKYGESIETRSSRGETSMLVSILEKAVRSFTDLIGVTNKRTFTSCSGVNSGTHTPMGGMHQFAVTTFYNQCDDNTSCAVEDNVNDHGEENSSHVVGGGDNEEDTRNPGLVGTVLDDIKQYAQDVKDIISGTPRSSLDIKGCPISPAAYDRIL
ncbi:hypothetical protein [Candidatus Anaplasma sp. TIGMIC]|uniref:hypothetical protein n=1 Tax=Candidatus Anaplasma sp. TIGMIC TaxID=3020713 RepID=UPI00232ACF9D|nr:hypothetical protein [Candidatus Anaplasma sp. TIGMIC]MDB1135411.1 hypothetical protein [Candidatus Anaplasma sp. TIGMIC]